MILILCNWIYIFITTLILGWGFAKVIQGMFQTKIKHLDSVIAIGFMLATWFAQLFSLFYKVAEVANLCLILICALIVMAFRKKLVQDIKNYVQPYIGIKGLAVGALLVIWAYLTSRGYMHYDSDLYHAQSIRWIEEYGVVKGLGQIHVRFGYNSSLFAVSALYSMKFLVGQSLHAVNGFLALVLSTTVLNVTDVWKRKKFRISDYAKIAAIYYLFIICDEIVSPASDYTIMCTVFFILIKWLELLETKTKEITPFALLCVGGVFAVTVKVTAGLILLLTIKPAVMLVQQKRWKEIAVYISMGIIMLFPWMARTVIITGYLLYPFPVLDLFSFDWKIEKSVVEWDSAEIKVWGRALYDTALVNTPMTQWIPNWFKTTLGVTEKAIIVMDFLCCIAGAMMAGYTLIKRKKEWYDMLLVLTSIVASYMFWQYNAPIFRYGYAYVLLLPAVMIGIFLSRLENQQLMRIGVLLFVVWKIIATGKYAYSVCQEPYYIRQKEYGTYALETYEVDGITFYYPLEGDRTGYDAFPAIPVPEALELRGNTIKDGFRRSNP